MKKVDLTGARFGRLTVIRESPVKVRNKVTWVCKCDCGNTSLLLPGNALRSGNTRSCGCLHKEELTKRMTKHGMRHTRLYGVWNCIKNRCLNEHVKDFPYYGGRGIKICEEWKDDFVAFHDWAMANGYNEKAARGECTIDRIDVNGDYSPDNCRWVPMSAQSVNKRVSKPDLI